MKIVNRSELILADLRIYDIGYGVEVDLDMPKVLLKQIDGVFCNVFNENESYPLLKRLPYSNTSKDGDTYGNKLQVVGEKLESKEGLCAVESIEDFFKDDDKKIMSIEELEEMVINSELFFKDRAEILYRRASEITSSRKARKIMKKVERDYDKLLHYQEQYNRLSEDYTKVVVKI